jgi:hypothetical protein
VWCHPASEDKIVWPLATNSHAAMKNNGRAAGSRTSATGTVTLAIAV